jgi:hypothetical protein
LFKLNCNYAILSETKLGSARTLPAGHRNAVYGNQSIAKITPLSQIEFSGVCLDA